MPDTTFETLLASQLREYADAGVRPIDRFAIAEDAVAGGRAAPGWRGHWGVAATGRSRALVPLVVVVLLAAVAGAALLVSGRFVVRRTTLEGGVPILLRYEDGPEPGVAVIAVRSDGSEVLIRNVSDSILPGSGKGTEWGTVSRSGWLALSVAAEGWPMVLIDLRDPQATPWVIDEANTGGIGPSWGPTGLLAADAGGNGRNLIIVDPQAHTTRLLPIDGGLVGGGPSIFWAADGSGVISSRDGAFGIVPADGGDRRTGIGAVFDPSGHYGPGLSELRICDPDSSCPGVADGRVERVEDGSATTIWQQSGGDRALAASFGAGPDEYWLSVDHEQGRQVALVHLQDGPQEVVATLNRDAAWQSVGAPMEAPDGSALLIPVDTGGKPDELLVPLDGGKPTSHTGAFAGFVDSAALDAVMAGKAGTVGATLPAVGEAFRLASLDQLIAAEQATDPGHTVLGKASHDAVEGATQRSTFAVLRDWPGGQLTLDCQGPSSVTVTSGSHSTTNPCLQGISYGLEIDASGPITMSATGDTSWRVVVYTP